MESVFALLMLSFLIVSNVSGEVISLVPDDEVCLEATVTFTCIVNGTNLGWRYGGSGLNTRFYFSPSGPNSLATLGSGPFRTRVTSVSGGMITSIATTSNLTRDANELTLECSDGPFTSTAKIRSVELNLRDFITPISFVLSNSVNSIFILPNECNSMRRAEVSDESGFIETISSSSALLSFTPPGPGLYTFNVSNLDSNGQIIASDSFSFNWNVSAFEVGHNLYFDDTDANILSINIIADQMNQPEVSNCSITLMSNDGNDNISSCFDRELREVVFFPVSYGTIYTYDVTITNALGSSNRTGPNVPIDFSRIRPVVTATVEMTIVPSESLISLECSSSPEPFDSKPICTNVIVFVIPLGLLGLWCMLSIVFCILHLFRRDRLCGLVCWTLTCWTYVFCECFRKESNSDENIVSLKKDESNL